MCLSPVEYFAVDDVCEGCIVRNVACGYALEISLEFLRVFLRNFLRFEDWGSFVERRNILRVLFEIDVYLKM